MAKKTTLTQWMVKPNRPFYQQPWYWGVVGLGAFLLFKPKGAHAALVKSGPVTKEEAAAAIHKEYRRASPALSMAIVDAALSVGAHPYDLANLIHFESAGTFSAQVENIRCKKINGPDSGKCAVGLIQFLPSTAAGLFGMSKEGTNSRGNKVYTAAQKKSAYARMSSLSAVAQARYVKQYLKRQARRSPNGKLDTPFKVAMAVFYPAAINKSPDWPFPPAVTRYNPGVKTPRDYTNAKFARADLPRSDQLTPLAFTA
tara:strand:+ start:440 stop:1210 length:771 start_codon:yes stop_codon:yes gene_type:complete